MAVKPFQSRQFRLMQVSNARQGGLRRELHKLGLVWESSHRQTLPPLQFRSLLLYLLILSMNSDKLRINTSLYRLEMVGFFDIFSRKLECPKVTPIRLFRCAPCATTRVLHQESHSLPYVRISLFHYGFIDASPIAHASTTCCIAKVFDRIAYHFYIELRYLPTYLSIIGYWKY